MPDPEGADAPSVVADQEILYRSIWLKSECFYIDQDGRVRVSAQAFADRKKTPSVFRHKLCEDPPLNNPPRLSDDDAVASLIAKQIRESASPIEHVPEKQGKITHIIDVVPDVSDGQHPSHAIVCATPTFQSPRAFERLKARLAFLIESNDLAVPPPAEFIRSLRATLL